MKPRIYCAGPISGLHYHESETWRDEYKKLVGPEIDCFSPLRQKEFLKSYGRIEQSYLDTGTPLSNDRGIMTRDHNDCKNADLIMCNLLDVGRVSIGTVMEIAWSFAYRIPLVLIMDKNSIHDHPMIREATGFLTKTIEEAAAVSRAILLPD